MTSQETQIALLEKRVRDLEDVAREYRKDKQRMLLRLVLFLAATSTVFGGVIWQFVIKKNGG